MAYNTSKGTSWADQWDPESLYINDTNKANTGDGPSSKFFATVGDMFDKTKAAASTGVMKVKSGASAGINWIKDKYNNGNQMDL